MRSLRLRNGLINVGLFITSIIVVLAVMEVSLRVVRYDPQADQRSGREHFLRLSSDPDVKYELIPGAEGFAWGADIKINSHGHRGPEFSAQKNGRFRVITLGDSVTFGIMLPLESTFPYQLSELLKASSSGTDVLNLGVGGYDVLQEVSLLEYKGLAYEPDLVVLGFCFNDVGVASPNWAFIEQADGYRTSFIFHFRAAHFVAEKIGRTQTIQWMRKMNEPEVFLKEFEGRITAIGEDEMELRNLMQATTDDYPSIWFRDEYRIGRLRYSFEHLAAMAENAGFSVVVVIVPWLSDDTMGYPLKIPDTIVTLEAERVGFDVLDVVPDFMDAGLADLRIQEEDPVHPNKTGHSIVAQRLKTYIEGRWPEEIGREQD